jgi:tetratricopeptide (TPR) repeat protein
LTYEPDTGRYEATVDLDRVADVLGGRVVSNRFGRALVVERRYESDRYHGAAKIGDCELRDSDSLRLLDPNLVAPDGGGARTLFVDLETTGLSGGAGTVAFLVGCGWFDMGAFQIRQFLLTSYSAERALLSAVAECFDETSLLVTYNGKTFDVPVMETRWLFHRMDMPLDSVRHFDMLHPARRLWRARPGARDVDGEGGCRLTTLERVLCEVRRVGDVPGLEIPARYFRFLRSGDARPLEPVLEHNRLDLVSLAAVTARALQLVDEGTGSCRDAAEALALGKVYERAGSFDRAVECYRHAVADRRAHVDVRAEALYRLGLRQRRERRFAEAAETWRTLLALNSGRIRTPLLGPLRQFAAEALAIHHEHRERDFEGARELALLALDHTDDSTKASATQHRLSRLDRKIAAQSTSQLFG